MTVPELSTVAEDDDGPVTRISGEAMMDLNVDESLLQASFAAFGEDVPTWCVESYDISPMFRYLEILIFVSI